MASDFFDDEDVNLRLEGKATDDAYKHPLHIAQRMEWWLESAWGLEEESKNFENNMNGD